MLKRVLVVLFALATFAPVVSAQNMNIAESPKKPGDTLRYTIILDGPVKGTVLSLAVGFDLKTDPKSEQKGLNRNFGLRKFRKVSDTQYEVEGTIPEVISGVYLLIFVQIQTQEGGVRTYNYPDDLKQEIRIKIETSEKDIFPNIKSIEPAH